MTFLFLGFLKPGAHFFPTVNNVYTVALYGISTCDPIELLVPKYLYTMYTIYTMQCLHIYISVFKQFGKIYIFIFIYI